MLIFYLVPYWNLLLVLTVVCFAAFMKIFYIKNLQIEIVKFFFYNMETFCFCFLPNCSAQTSSTVLNRGDYSRHPYLIPNLRWIVFCFSPLSILAVFHRWSLSHRGRSHLFLVWWVFLQLKSVGFCQIFFSAYIEMTMQSLIFILLLWYITFIDF